MRQAEREVSLSAAMPTAEMPMQATAVSLLVALAPEARAQTAVTLLAATAARLSAATRTAVTRTQETVESL